MIPAELRALKGWVLWKLVAGEKPGDKPRKVPCYTNGRHRSGVQGSESDRARWATYEEAQAVLDADLAGTYEGLGFVLSPDWGVVGLDFDHCVDEHGVVHPDVQAVIEGTYAEFSPSGTGVHAFLEGKLPNKKSHADGERWGFETFCSKGFLTMTGHATPATELIGWGLDHVNGAVTELFEARFGEGAIDMRERVASAVAPLGLTDAELRDILSFHDPGASYTGNDRKDLKAGSWLRVGMALHHETGGAARGLDLWIEHSRGWAKYPGDELLKGKWESFGRGGDGEVTAVWLRLVAEARGKPLDDSGFEDVSEADDRPPVPAAQFEQSERTRNASIPEEVASSDTPPASPPPSRPLPSVRRRGIPEAHYLTTDQANANRIRAAYGALLFVAAGKWYVWTGQRWVADEGDVYRYACRLSDMVRSEAKTWEAKAAEADAAGDGAKVKELKAVAKAVGGWAVKCEMKGTIEAAVGLLRKMLTIEVDALDRDPWALNTLSGIVDLRTGEVRKHDPAAYITRLVPVRYVPEAPAEGWLRALRQITREDSDEGRGTGIVDFLQRWAGYCLTGSTREQALVVHWGPGSNGKSVVLEMLAETMGDYAGTAAPGLLMASKNDRHPTEIADLMGRRMVTAHESGEGMVLREDFIKQATGSDRLTARYMRGDFFEFDPTHKLQLVTNHKPQVKGQDLGIWRRMMLLEYGALFGTAAQVESGTHTHVKDVDMLARLRGELEGVLAWRVRGAVAWFAGGLAAPEKVLAATAGYRSQQDRVGQFVAECCEVGKGLEEPLAEGMGGGLYPAYHDWCKDAGILPLSKPRFKDDVLRVVPRAFAQPRKSAATGRKIVIVIHGLKLLDA